MRSKNWKRNGKLVSNSPILLESDGKLLIDCTADGICVLYPNVFRDGHDWYAFIDCGFNHCDVKLSKISKINIEINKFRKTSERSVNLLLTLDLDNCSDTMDLRTFELLSNNLDCMVNHRVVKCALPTYDCMCVSFVDGAGNYHSRTSPHNVHLFSVYEKTNAF